MRKYRALILLLCAVMVFSCGCSSLRSDYDTMPKTFSKGGITIELTNDFREKEVTSCTAYYESKEMVVFAQKEDFSEFEGKKYTLKEYAGLVITKSQISTTVEEKDGLVFFTFLRTLNRRDMMYYAFVYEGKDAYWLVQFAFYANQMREKEPVVLKYAASVQV